MPVYKKYNKDFFKIWTSDMAYILGFLFADGNVIKTKRNTHFIALYSADKEIVEEILQCFESDHKISERKSQTGNVFRIQVGSKEWFSDLGKIGLIPNKAKRMRLPDIPDAFLGDFVRGYFDGDGNVWVGEVHKKRKIATRTIQVSFTSVSNEYLIALKNRLVKRGIEGGSIYVSKKANFSRLTFSIRDALKLYEIMYNTRHKLYLKRKKVIFSQFVKNCGGSSTG